MQRFFPSINCDEYETLIDFTLSQVFHMLHKTALAMSLDVVSS